MTKIRTWKRWFPLIAMEIKVYWIIRSQDKLNLEGIWTLLISWLLTGLRVLKFRLQIRSNPLKILMKNIKIMSVIFHWVLNFVNSPIETTFKWKIRNKLIKNKLWKIKTMINKLVQLKYFQKADQNYYGKNHFKNFTTIYKI